MTKKEVLAILQQHNLHPQKQKGQNFLINDTISQKIVNEIKLNHRDVLEIGPGLGALTKHLSTKYNVTAVELDRGFVKYLRAAYPRVTIIEQNILKYNVPRETKAVISNLPYYITTKTIEHIVINNFHVEEFIFMVESEVANRLFGRPKTKAYNPLAIVLALYGMLTKSFNVSKQHFYPSPHVTSTVFRFQRKKENTDPQPFYKFLKTLFLNRRKTLLNNTKHLNKNTKIMTFLDKHNLKHNVRAEELTPQTLQNLYQYIENEAVK